MRRKKNKKTCKTKKDKVEGTKPADPSAEILVDEKAEAILPIDHSAEILVDAKAEAILQAELQSKLVRNKVKKLVKHHKLKLLASILKQASSDEPWGPSVQAKVRSIEGLILSQLHTIVLLRRNSGRLLCLIKLLEVCYRVKSTRCSFYVLQFIFA